MGVITKFDGVLFDMDGLIFNTEHTLKKCWQKAAKKQNLILTDQDYASFVGTKDNECEDRIKHIFGSQVDMLQYVKDRNELYEQVRVSPPDFMDGFENFFTTLINAKKKIALVTSSPLVDVKFNFSANDYLSYFNVIVTGDDVKNGKPDPECFLLASKKLNLDPSQCLVFEDSNQGVKAAALANCQVVMIPDLVAPNDFSKQHALEIISSFNELFF